MQWLRQLSKSHKLKLKIWKANKLLHTAKVLSQQRVKGQNMTVNTSDKDSLGKGQLSKKLLVKDRILSKITFTTSSNHQRPTDQTRNRDMNEVFKCLLPTTLNSPRACFVEGPWRELASKHQCSFELLYNFLIHYLSFETHFGSFLGHFWMSFSSLGAPWDNLASELRSCILLELGPPFWRHFLAVFSFLGIRYLNVLQFASET